MSIATPAEVRRAVTDAATVLGHPTKGSYATGKIQVGQPHKYGSVVYREGGQVGICIGDGTYLVARGENHEMSLYGLVLFLNLPIPTRKDGVTPFVPDVGIQVDEVDAGHFWLFCLPEGYTLPEG